MTQTDGNIYCDLGLKEITVKMTILSKAIYILNVTLFKLTMTYFINKEKINLYQNTKDSDI